MLEIRKLAFLLILSVAAVVFLIPFFPLCGLAETSVPSATSGVLSKSPPVSSKGAWQQKWDNTVALAKKEGQLTIYGEIFPDLRLALIKALKERFGIELNVVSGKAPEVAQKYLTENQNNLHLADVLMTGQTTTLNVVKPRGVLAPIPPLLILPEVTDPAAWREGKVPYLDKDALAVPLVASYRSFLLFNTQMVSAKDAGSYQDIMDPKWKGKIIFYDPTIGGSAATWVAFIIKTMGTEEGTKFLRQFAQQTPTITRDARLQVESVAKGKFPLGLGASSQVVSNFQKVQAPIEWAKVKEGGIVIAGGAVISLPQKRSHPNASNLFLNWILTRDGQTVFAKGFGHPARRADVSTEGIDPSVIPPKGAKVFWANEDFFLLEEKLRSLSREIFANLMKK